MIAVALVVFFLIFFVVPGALVFVAGRSDDRCGHDPDCGETRC